MDVLHRERMQFHLLVNYIRYHLLNNWMVLRQLLSGAALAALVSVTAGEKAHAQEAPPAAAVEDFPEVPDVYGTPVAVFSDADIRNTNLTLLVEKELRNLQIIPYRESKSFPPSEGAVFVYEGADRADGHYPADEEDLFYITIARHLRGRTDLPFFLLQMAHASAEQYPHRGIYLIRNRNVLDSYSNNPYGYSGRDRQAHYVVPKEDIDNLDAWTKDPENLRFFGSGGLRYLQAREIKVSIATDNDLLRTAQTCINEGKYDAARLLLGKDYSTVDDVALCGLLRGILDIHLALDRWRNRGEEIDLDQVLTAAKVHFDIATIVSEVYKKELHELLLREGILVYNGELLIGQTLLPSPEEAVRTWLAAKRDHNAEFFNRARQLSVAYWRRYNEDTAELEAIDFSTIDWGLVDKFFPEYEVVAWRLFDPAGRYVLVSQSRIGNREKSWHEGGNFIDESNGTFHRILEP